MVVCWMYFYVMYFYVMYFYVNEFQVRVNDSIFSGNEQ